MDEQCLDGVPDLRIGASEKRDALVARELDRRVVERLDLLPAIRTLLPVVRVLATGTGVF